MYNVRARMENIGKIKNPLGRFSHCQKIHKINTSLPSNLEQIFVLKDSNLEDFYSQVDKISLWPIFQTI